VMARTQDLMAKGKEKPMFKKFFSLFIAALLLNTMICVQPASADSKQEKQTRLADKVKIGISKLGVGKEALVEVKLRDKTKLAGFVGGINENHFVVTNVKIGNSTSIAYTDVQQVSGHNLSTGAKIAIGIGIGVGIALIVFAIYLNCCTG
jgi:hypothetical protein